MRYALAYAALVSTASAHGLVTMVKGANGVMMPGLSSKPTPSYKFPSHPPAC